MDMTTELDRERLGHSSPDRAKFFPSEFNDKLIISEVLPALLDKNEKVKVWCCDSGAGEMAYTVAMILDLHLPKGVEFKILATDQQKESVQKAANGVYPLSRLEEIPPEYRSQSTVIGEKTAAGFFKMKNSLRSKIEFKEHDLKEETYPGDDIFDLIFCRSVEGNQILLDKLHRSLKPEGFLFCPHQRGLGHS